MSDYYSMFIQNSLLKCGYDDYQRDDKSNHYIQRILIYYISDKLLK